MPVATAGWNPVRSRDGYGHGTENSHNWRLDLPGSVRAGKTETLEQAKQAAELAFADWCAAAGLVAK